MRPPRKPPSPRNYLMQFLGETSSTYSHRIPPHLTSQLSSSSTSESQSPLLPTSQSSTAKRKRYAPAECRGLPRKRSRSSSTYSPSPPASPASPALPGLNLPEPASINAILRDHCRTRLFVQPILWTSQHLRLLDCQFVSIKIPQGTSLWDMEGHRDPQRSLEIVQRLCDLLRPSMVRTQCSMVDELLAAYGLARWP